MAGHRAKVRGPCDQVTAFTVSNSQNSCYGELGAHCSRAPAPGHAPHILHLPVLPSPILSVLPNL